MPKQKMICEKGYFNGCTLSFSSVFSALHQNNEIRSVLASDAENKNERRASAGYSLF
jgi:hypothetical protein